MPKLLLQPCRKRLGAAGEDRLSLRGRARLGGGRDAVDAAAAELGALDAEAAHLAGRDRLGLEALDDLLAALDDGADPGVRARAGADDQALAEQRRLRRERADQVAGRLDRHALGALEALR